MSNEAARVETNFRVIGYVSERPISGVGIKMECVGHGDTGYQNTDSDGWVVIKHRYTGWHQIYVRVQGVKNDKCFKVMIGPSTTVTVKVGDNGYMECDVRW